MKLTQQNVVPKWNEYRGVSTVPAGELGTLTLKDVAGGDKVLPKIFQDYFGPVALQTKSHPYDI